MAFLHTIHITASGYSVDFTNIASHLSLTTEDPGGDGMASFEVVVFSSDSDCPTMPPLGAQMRIADEAGVYWIGRVEEPELETLEVDGSVQGFKATITARGYGSALDDIIYTASQVWIAGTAARQVVIDTLAAIGPPTVILDAGQIHGGGTPLADDSHDALGESSQSIINRYMSQWSNDGTKATWGIGYNGTFDGPTFTMGNRPTAGSFAYQVDVEDCISSTISWPLQWIRNGVLVKFSGGEYYGVDGTNRAALGIRRDLFLDVSNAVGDIGTAEYLANQILGQFAAVRPFGRTIEIDYAYGAASNGFLITDSTGSPVPPWRVRAGQNIKINNFGSGTASLPFDTLFIKSTSWDEDSRRLGIQTEQRESLGQIVGRITQSTSTPTVNQPSSVVPIALSPGVPPAGAVNNAAGAGGQFVQAGKDGKVNSGDMPPGWDLVSFNFVMNGGGSPITVGQKGWIGLDYNVVIERVALIASATDTGASDCAISFKLWHDDNMQTNLHPAIPGSYFTLDNGTTTLFQISGGTRGIFPVGKMHINADTLWGIEVTNDIAPTAVIADVWLTGRRFNTGDANISPNAPVITALMAAGNQITWLTDTASTSQVFYGVGGDFSSSTPLDGTVVFDSSTPAHQVHTVNLPGLLVSGQAYEARVESVDGSGRKSTDSISWTAA